MENLADALKISFAVLIFVIALSITFFLMSRSRETADKVLWYSDKTNYRTETLTGDDGRTVGVDTVITALKNRQIHSVYITIIENDIEGGNEYTYTLSKIDDEKAENYIKEHISGLKSSYRYKEIINDITVDGTFAIADDLTKIPVRPGAEIKRILVYKKI